MMGTECLLLVPFLLNYSSLDKAGKFTFYYLISSICFAFGSRLTSIYFGNNLWFFAIMQLLQFSLLSTFYYLVIKSPVVKNLIRLLLIPVVIIFFLDILKLEGVHTYNSIFASIQSFLLISYGITFFLQILFDNDLVKSAVFINALPNFWFNAGLFIYLCASFLFSLTYNFFLQHSLNNTDAKGILALTYVAGIIEMILFYIGLMKAKKHRT